MAKNDRPATGELPGAEKNGKHTDENVEGLAGETRNNVTRVIEIERAQRAGRTRAERISEYIAAFCGSMTFVWVHVIWFGLWVGINSYPPYAFDPFPFTFLTLVVSLEAIFLSTFILISQNQETKLTERRNHLDLQINMLTEQENTKLLELLTKVAEKVGVKVEDPVVENLLQDMDPETLVEQIMAVKSEEGLEDVADQVADRVDENRKEAEEAAK